MAVFSSCIWFAAFFQDETRFQDEIRDTSRTETESRLGVLVGQEPKRIGSWMIYRDGQVRKKVGRQHGWLVRKTIKEKFSWMSRDAKV
ncbi:hypothetical protein BHG07_05730 [Brenneria salicis ATCC 15712 = DSM 30166]|nr:hypothetical protein BHG07_05730 [Brenneria salicis ATCC 15712 = DSM 30166]